MRSKIIYAPDIDLVESTLYCSSVVVSMTCFLATAIAILLVYWLLPRTGCIFHSMETSKKRTIK
jgi:hypothetical protein